MSTQEIWISVVELPVLAGLFWLIQNQRARFDEHVQRQNLYFSNFRLEVAKGYVRVGYLKDIEARLTQHLLRIEEKLDLVEKQNLPNAVGPIKKSPKKPRKKKV